MQGNNVAQRIRGGALGGLLGGCIWLLFKLLTLLLTGNPYVFLGVVYLALPVLFLQLLVGGSIGLLVVATNVVVRNNPETHIRALIGAVGGTIISAGMRALTGMLFGPVVLQALWLCIPYNGVWEEGIKSTCNSPEWWVWGSIVGVIAGLKSDTRCSIPESSGAD